MLLTTISLLVVAQPISIYRGAPLFGQEGRYWSCEDTSMDRRNPTTSNGQGRVMFINRDHRVLIRFGDLENAIGPNKRVIDAKLVLSMEGVQTEGDLKLHRFLTPWWEGPGTARDQDKNLVGSTTWEYQLYLPGGRIRSWKNGGAEFLTKDPSAAVKISKSSETIEIGGLASDVQLFYERWYENHGWAIEFTGNAAFTSSEGSLLRRPKLILTVENIEEKKGADLSVTCIIRTPEYERYDNRGNAYVTDTVDGHTSGIMMNPGSSDTQKWPKDGEQVTYTAIVKNVGNVVSDGFSYMFSENWEQTTMGTVNGPIYPGETKEVSFMTSFLNRHDDHRWQPVSCSVNPKGEDAYVGNNYLEIQACALNIGIWVDETFYKIFGEKPNATGTRSFEDWIQWQFRIWNDVFMRHSRFSIAPDGCKERTRVGRITIVPDGALKGGAHIPNDTPTLIYDGEWGFDSSFGNARDYIDIVRTKTDRALLHEMSHQIGLIDLYWMNVDPSMPDGSGGKVRLKFDGNVVTRGAMDLWGGLMGGGDTRNEWLIPGPLAVPQWPSYDPIFSSEVMSATDLYSLTDVWGLNSNLGFRRGFYGEFMYDLPAVVTLRCVDRDGNIIPNGKLSFHQMKHNEIPDAQPDFVVPINGGTVVLPNRATGLSEPYTVITGHTIRPNIFGRIDVVGSNGVFLIRLDYEGQTEWAFVKAWEFVDAYARGNKSVFVKTIEFNVTTRPLKPENLAVNRIALDSINSSAANLAKLTDIDFKTEYEAGQNVNDWFEIDLGRDRPIGEVCVVMNGDAKAFWKKFDIMVYSTGQNFASARRFASEMDWIYSATQRRDVDPLEFSVQSVAYRARPQTVRFIRFVNRSEGGGRVAGVVVREVEFAR